jgi:hypothetical protein
MSSEGRLTLVLSYAACIAHIDMSAHIGVQEKIRKSFSMGCSPNKKKLDTRMGAGSAGENIFHSPVAFFISGVTGMK